MEAAGEEHGSRIDRVPAAAVESDEPPHDVVRGRHEADPAIPLLGSLGELLARAADPDVAHLRQCKGARMPRPSPEFWGGDGAARSQKPGIVGAPRDPDAVRGPYDLWRHHDHHQ